MTDKEKRLVHIIRRLVTGDDLSRADWKYVDQMLESLEDDEE